MEFPEQEETTNSNSNFCLRFANYMLQENADQGSNMVISPFSFHLLLSLIAVGSKGRTLDILLQCLGSKTLEDLNSVSSQMIVVASQSNESNSVERGDPDLSFVNGAWVALGLKLKPSFKEILEGVYNAIAKEVDFINKAEEIVADINAWAETATKGLIKNLLTKEALNLIAGDTDLILANAFYFKGTWAQRFDTSKTENRAFHLLNGETVDVPFMTSIKSERYHYRSFNGYRTLKLPYRENQACTRQFAMYFFLPDARDGLKNLLQMFKSDPELFSKQSYLPKQKIDDFWIPRFKFGFEFEASESMKELGLNLPFNPKMAEITEMVEAGGGGGNLYVAKMFHKSFIEVNEEGTEAAACTRSLKRKSSLRYPIPSFVADHPFMFMIKEDKSGTVFFIGAVLNPQLQ